MYKTKRYYSIGNIFYSGIDIFFVFQAYPYQLLKIVWPERHEEWRGDIEIGVSAQTRTLFRIQSLDNGDTSSDGFGVRMTAELAELQPGCLGLQGQFA